MPGPAPPRPEIIQPSLVIQSSDDQGCFPSDAKAIFDALASEDKTLETIRGDHYLQIPLDARDEVADIISAWVSVRT